MEVASSAVAVIKTVRLPNRVSTTSVKILVRGKTCVDQMRSAVARIMRSRAHALLVFMVILLRSKVAFECQTRVKRRKTVPASICASRDYANASARSRTIARRASDARTAFV